MAVAEREATVVWHGNLRGSGVVTGGSGAISQLPVTFASRTEQPEGRTSPEELLAAAHATCFAMAFANALDKAGTPPEAVSVNAHCTLDRVDGALRVTTMQLIVRGTANGATQGSFAAIAHETSDTCPISQALTGNVQISVDATLE